MQSTPQPLSIGEVARLAGLRPSAIRYYERVGLLPQATRVGGRRQYDDSILRRLAAIRLGQRAGFTLSEIRTLWKGFPPSTPPSERWSALGREKLGELDALIERAQRMKRVLGRGLECRCLTLEQCELVAEQMGAGGDGLNARGAELPAA